MKLSSLIKFYHLMIKSMKKYIYIRLRFGKIYTYLRLKNGVIFLTFSSKCVLIKFVIPNLKHFIWTLKIIIKTRNLILK